jgi:hypothetical protein
MASIERWGASAVRQNLAAVDIGHIGKSRRSMTDRQRSAGHFEIRGMSVSGTTACGGKAVTRQNFVFGTEKL